VLAWIVTVGAVLVGTVAFTNEKTWYFGPRATVVLVLAALGLPTLALRAWRSTLAWPARAAIGFLVVAALSAALSPVPWVGFFGLEEFGTGWVFLLCLAALWALGSDLTESGAALLGRGLVLLGLLNAGAVVLEVGGKGWSPLNTVVAHIPGMLFGQGQPTGFADNPVFGAQVIMGGLALLAWRAEERNPWTWWAMTALTGAGLYLSGERFGLIVLVALVAWVFVVRKKRPGIAFAIAGIGGTVVGVLFEQLVKLAGTAQFRSIAAEGGNGAFGPRLRIWTASLHAIAAHPILGGGPSQAASATLPYRSTITVIQDGLFTDVHNFVIEIAVTTGLLGLALFLAWLLPALRASRGPLLLYTVVLLAGGLIEPFDITSTSLAFLALGAATVGVAAVGSEPASAAPRLPEWSTIAGNVARGVLVLVALFAGINLMVGNTELKSGLDSVNPVTLAAASGHLPMWSDAPGAVADALTFIGNRQHNASYIRLAIHWNDIALSRDPQDAQTLTRLGIDELTLGQLSAAEQALNRSLVYGPDYEPTYALHISLAMEQGDTASAIHWAKETHGLFQLPQLVPVISCLQQHDSPKFTKAQVAAACSPLMQKVPES
jgi:O-antigen ligase/type IV secretory pathway VirB2 component (pilin)